MPLRVSFKPPSKAPVTQPQPIKVHTKARAFFAVKPSPKSSKLISITKAGAVYKSSAATAKLLLWIQLK